VSRACARKRGDAVNGSRQQLKNSGIELCIATRECNNGWRHREGGGEITDATSQNEHARPTSTSGRRDTNRLRRPPL
jgi:hypothetical protein